MSRAAMCPRRRAGGLWGGAHARASRSTTPRRRAATAKGRSMKLRVGIDVGGTFTDVTVFDEDAARSLPYANIIRVLPIAAAVMDKITQRARRDFGAGLRVADPAWLDRGAQHFAGGQWRACRASDHRADFVTFTRSAGNGAARRFSTSSPRRRRCCSRATAFSRSANGSAQGRGDRAAARATRLRRARKLLADGVEAVAVCFLFAYADPPSRAGGRGHHSRNGAGSLCFAFARGQSGMARIRAHRCDGGERAISGRRSRAICARSRDWH